MATDPPDRVPTGTPGLDSVLHGGFLPRSTYLLVGDAGTGKTLTSLQWLRSGAAAGQRCLYIALSEPLEHVERVAHSLGWSLDGIDRVDLYPSPEEQEEVAHAYTLFPPSDVEQTTVWGTIFDAVRTREPAYVVLDSVTQLRYLSPDPYQFRRQIRGFVAFLFRQGCTSVFTFETTEHEREAAVALAADGVVRLRRRVSERRVVELRSLEVEKHRGSAYMGGYHALQITGAGVRVFPHRVEDPGDVESLADQVRSGIGPLDRQLGGGLEVGTATILTGQSGVGKSSLSMQFALSAVGAGHRAVFYTFEESRGSILARSRSLSMDLNAALESGTLDVVRINPIELYPDEFLQTLRRAVEEEDRSFVVIDSLRGYDLAMAEFATPVANLHNLVSYLTRQRVTCIMTNEIEELTGSFIPTELGVSYIADNVLLLRYAEGAGEVVRLISCLKKRHGPFERTLRPFEITGDGIVVGDEVRHVRGLLSGMPHLLAPGA